MKNFWLRQPPIGKGFIVIVAIGVVWSALSDAMATPEQRAISNCISKLNKAAQGGISGAQLEKNCILMQQRGQM